MTKAGDIVAIPLPHGGFATAVVTSTERKYGLCVLTVFGPRMQSVRDARTDLAARSDLSIMVVRTSSDMIESGAWERVGEVAAFSPEAWAQTEFLRAEPYGRGTVVVTYGVENPAQPESERQAQADDDSLPGDGLVGWRALTYILDEALLEKERVDSETWGEPWR
jgi:hypothetical protein